MTQPLSIRSVQLLEERTPCAGPLVAYLVHDPLDCSACRVGRSETVDSSNCQNSFDPCLSRWRSSSAGMLGAPHKIAERKVLHIALWCLAQSSVVQPMQARALANLPQILCQRIYATTHPALPMVHRRCCAMPTRNWLLHAAPAVLNRSHARTADGQASKGPHRAAADASTLEAGWRTAHSLVAGLP